MKLKKICILSAVALLLVASVAMINPSAINLGEVINHPWKAVIYLF